MPLKILRGDISLLECDAIVNATDPHMSGGGGVDAVIHQSAGPELDLACQALGACAPGQAKATEGYELPCRWVIHTVGPRWYHGKRREREILASCYRESLELALEKDCKTLAFPLIASGTYGFPKPEALQIAHREITEFLSRHDMTVYLVVYDRESFEIGQSLYREIEEYIDERYVKEHSPALTEPMACRSELSRAMPFTAPALPQQAPAKKRGTRKEQEMAQDSLESTLELNVPTLEEALAQIDESFSEMLLRKIDEKGITDAQCYKKANIDRKLFSKIRSNPRYKPSKATAVAFAIGLELSPAEAEDLLRKAGYALSHSSKFDIIVEYFLQKGIYDIFQINEALFAFDQVLLGQ